MGKKRTVIRNVRTASKEEMDRRDGIMALAEGESKHVADELLRKQIESGEFEEMYSREKR